MELSDLKTQLDLGAISSLDYLTKENNIKNMNLSKEGIEVYCWMYEVLLKLF